VEIRWVKKGMRPARDAQSGMSATGLLVLVIVATFVVVIIAATIPSFLASREPGQRPAIAAHLKANEAGVIAALRRIHSAEATYSLTNAGTYGTFVEMSAANILDTTWTDTPVKNGYGFTLTTGSKGLGYCVTAERTSDSVGDDSYSMSQQGVIFYLAGDTAPTCDADTGLISTGAALGS